MRISAAIAMVAMAVTSFMASVRAEANPEATVELNEKNFLDHIASKDLAMINFYTGQCARCQSLGSLPLHCGSWFKLCRFRACDLKY